MYSNLALAAALATTVSAEVYQGFNYGSSFTNDAPKMEKDFHDEFMTAQGLVGHPGFTSARLYTMIQKGTDNAPISAIPAALSTNTSLLLGMWASAGQAAFDQELTALSNSLTQYGSDFIDLIAGISVGSEDLYRETPTGIKNKAGQGENPDVLVGYIQQVRDLLKKAKADQVAVGHVDTWTAWVNGSNNDVINSCDWIGVDMYPYFQTNDSNGIDNAANLFFEAYGNTTAVSAGKPVWITETGQPVSGKTSGENVPSIENARKYWEQVACKILGNVSTWWYTLQDVEPETPDPSFGLTSGPALTTEPLYDLSCPNQPSKPSTGPSTSTTGLPSDLPSATGVAPGGSSSASPSGPSSGSPSVYPGAPGSSAPGSPAPAPGSSYPGAPGSSAPGSSSPGAPAPGSSYPGAPGSSAPGSPAPAPGSSYPGAPAPAPGSSAPGSSAPGAPAPAPPGSYGTPPYGTPVAGAPGAASTPGAYNPASTPGTGYTGGAAAQKPAAVLAAVAGLVVLLA